MVTVPIAVLLIAGVVISLTRGKGSALFGLMCLLLGVLVADTEFGRALIDLTRSAAGAAGDAGASTGLGGP